MEDYLYPKWVKLTDTVDFPRLGWLIQRLAEKGIDFRIDYEASGYGNTPAVMVMEHQLNAAYSILCPVEELEDYRPRFASVPCVECGMDAWPGEDDEEPLCTLCNMTFAAQRYLGGAI